MCYLSYEVPNLGPEGGKFVRPTHVVRHTQNKHVGNRTPSNLKLHHRNQNPSYIFFWQDDGPPLANGALCLSTIVNPPLHLSHWDNIKDTTNTDTSTLYLDLHLKFDSEGQLRMKLRQKRWFQFSHCELSIYI